MSEGATFVTGATGFLGGALVRALLAQGKDVVASGRQAKRLEALEAFGARALKLDLEDDVSRFEDQAPPEAELMVHCAALSSPWGKRVEFERANIEGTRAAINLARKMGVRRFVHISTPSVYFRFADQVGVSEASELPNPVNTYAETKAAAEALVLAATDLDPIILRPRGLYGAGDTSLLPRLLRSAEQRALPLMRGGAAAIDLTHIDDVVGAVRAALQVRNVGDARVFNVSGGAMLPVVDVVEAACERAGITPRWRKLPVGVVMAYARAAEALCKMRPAYPEPPITAYAAGLFAYRQSLDISLARQHLGWVPQIGFEEGLDRTFAEGGA